ncbi:hypothetical protein HOLleu_15764 [Holothuria leucospilota]|uniref:Zinc finger MYM-type 1-like n=1 Tax=Holothuria leucospilota TaxID=206669 RepID=A0A9Q1C474_HOLLE|nr:hypothetical protein HOLleu_15764 [Holothuria leucospilota]
MTGHKTGAVQRIRERVARPWLVGVHCSGHKLELAYKDMVKQKIPLYDKLESLLLNIYYFYRNSNLNRALLKESFATLNQKVILPTRVGGTRWIGHLKLAIDNILSGYEALLQHFDQLQNPDGPSFGTEKACKAKNFHKILSTKDAWLMLHFLQDALSILTSVSTKFQDQQATIAEIIEEIEMAIVNLKKLQTSDGPNLRKARQMPPNSLTGNTTSFDSARVQFIEQLLVALRKRFTEFPGGDTDKILRHSSVINLKTFPKTKEEAKDYGDKEIASLVDFFKPGLDAAGVKSDEYAERGFSRLKTTKTDWRSNLSDSHLSDLLVILIESPEVTEYNPDAAVDHWFQAAKRRGFHSSGCEKHQDLKRKIYDDDDDDYDDTAASLAEDHDAYSNLFKV